jgi:hypothetical protein
MPTQTAAVNQMKNLSMNKSYAASRADSPAYAANYLGPLLCIMMALTNRREPSLSKPKVDAASIEALVAKFVNNETVDISLFSCITFCGR